MSHFDALMASLAYPKNRHHLWEGYRFPEGYSIVELDYHGSAAQLIAAANEDEVTIGIAGTNEFVDWGFNADLAHVSVETEHGEILVHRGIWKYTNQVAYAIQQHGVTRGRRVRVVGHSLGGASALLLPLLMPEIESVTTFGAPRCLLDDTAFRYPRKVDVFRYVRPLDIVPDLPLAIGWGISPLTGWSHVGNVRWLFNDGTIKTELTSWDQFRRRCVRLMHWINDGFARSVLKEHNAADGYLKLLKE